MHINTYINVFTGRIKWFKLCLHKLFAFVVSEKNKLISLGLMPSNIGASGRLWPTAVSEGASLGTRSVREGGLKQGRFIFHFQRVFFTLRDYSYLQSNQKPRWLLLF